MNSLRSMILFLGILFTGFGLQSQTLNHEVTYAEGRKMLLGKCNREGLNKEAYKEWFDKNYEAHAIDAAVLEKCKDKLDGIEIQIFMGTWCGDSRREVPRFYKVMDELGVGEDQISLINLNRGAEKTKQSPTHEEVGKLIHRVPTFIVMKEGKEIGRIVETPVTSFEIDLAQILHGFPSAPNYKVVMRLNKLLDEKNIPTDRKELIEIARAVQHDSWNDGELNTFGYVLMAAGDIDRAIAVFTINTMLHRNVPNVWDSLGEAYEKAERLPDALKMYEAVVKLDPDNEHALEKIASLKASLKDG